MKLITLELTCILNRSMV